MARRHLWLLTGALALGCDRMPRSVGEALEAVSPATVPPEKEALVGTWVGPNTTLVVRANGMAEHTPASPRRAVEGPIVAWTEDGFTLGTGDDRRTLAVPDPPRPGPTGEVLGVDGELLRRVGPAAAAPAR